ncbi:universal stress protein [Halomarina oriensis]|uniref:Universal stress protein n=1 Tax=Halomarina oriensis TaxID=671145 RepID=A0A6B0GIP3_9EURY|nr:universal stress protein [Halomarina oriensis]MWG34624.1 universal stress protein [Halomarina oriensis]
MYDRILAPTDGSDPATAAVRHALALARTTGATVHAVYVLDTRTGFLTVSKDEVRGALREVGEDAATTILNEVERLATDADVELVTEVVDGAPDQAILDYAADHDVDHIVVGTHGRTGLERRLLGSVTERVIGGASVPVTAVHGDDAD